MADITHRQQVSVSRDDSGRQVSRKSVLYASLVSLVIGGPLLGMMGFSFIASATLLLITAPLFLLFSPLLFFALFVVVGAVAGFSVAEAMALTGITLIGWMVREVRGGNVGFGATSLERLGEKMMSKEEDFTGYLQLKGKARDGML